MSLFPFNVKVMHSLENMLKKTPNCAMLKVGTVYGT